MTISRRFEKIHPFMASLFYYMTTSASLGNVGVGFFVVDFGAAAAISEHLFRNIPEEGL